MIKFQRYQDSLPEYIPPTNFEDNESGFHPISLNLTPQELHEMQEIVDDFDFEDQQEKNKLKTTLAMMHGNFILSLCKMRDILEIFKSNFITQI